MYKEPEINTFPNSEKSGVSFFSLELFDITHTDNDALFIC